jgi:hypothetical protein
MNKLFVGFDRVVEPVKGCLFIDDEIPEIPDKFRPKIFDPKKHHFNPLRNITKKKARDISKILYAASPQGENTLTVRNGRRALAKALLRAKRLDEVEGDEEVTGMIDDLLFTDEARKVFCNQGKGFDFDTKSVILARVNRAELGEEDALTLGLFLMLEYPGQIVVPNFGFLGRDIHVSLVDQNRLIAGLNTLAELPPKLRQAVLLIKDKEGRGATAEDADTLAVYNSRFPRGTNEFNAVVAAAMA